MKDLRIVITLMGDYQNNATVRTKHVHFFDALSRRYEVVNIFDAGLRGISRVINALSVAERNRDRWREHFYKNSTAFQKRSRLAANFLRSHKNDVDAALQIGALFDATAPDLFLPNIIYSDYTSVLSARKPEAGRSPFTPMERRGWIANETAALKHATNICTRSRLVRDSLITDYGLPPEKITVIGGGVNFNSLPVLPDQVIQRDPVLLFVGKDFYRKGGDLLLDAFQLATRKCPTARLIILTKDAIPEASPLQNVTVIRDHYSRDQMSQLYSSADLFVLPSRLETWGDVLLEAMAHSLPCIGVQSDAMSEIIEEERTGFLVPAGNIQTLADRMLLLIQNGELRKSMGEAARKKVESEFLWEHVVDRLAPVLSAAVEPVTEHASSL